MAATSILYVGDDICYRIPIMERAGLVVLRSDCSVDSVQHLLLQNGAPSAITFQCDVTAPEDIVLSTARRLSPAPLILFQNACVTCDEHLFDLIIADHTSPFVWLMSLAEAIEVGRGLRRASQQLRKDCADVRIQSDTLRVASARVCKTRVDPGGFWRGWKDYK